MIFRAYPSPQGDVVLVDVTEEGHAAGQHRGRAGELLALLHAGGDDLRIDRLRKVDCLDESRHHLESRAGRHGEQGVLREENLAERHRALHFPALLLGRLFDEGTNARVGLALERAFGVAAERPAGF